MGHPPSLAILRLKIHFIRSLMKSAIYIEIIENIEAMDQRLQHRKIVSNIFKRYQGYLYRSSRLQQSQSNYSFLAAAINPVKQLILPDHQAAEWR